MKQDIEMIAPWEIIQYRNRKDCMVIDLRPEEDFLEYHVPGAVNIPYDELNQYIGRLPREKTLVLYCERGGTAALAGKELHQLGFHVKAVMGGFPH